MSRDLLFDRFGVGATSFLPFTIPSFYLDTMVYTIIVHLKAKDLESADKIASKLVEAAAVYRKDKEQLAWMVHRDPKDPLKFAIVERFENEASQKYHLENPYWKTFDPFVVPLLDGPMDLTRWEEMPVSVPNQDSAQFALSVPQ
ncbi:hypothetical protein T439DRAFT_323870 [Meredithblackwellia eburnea MCA 4105]